MTTPTLSNRLWGEMRRQEGLKRTRHEAAKKAWQTRRRLAKPTLAMTSVLTYLVAHDEARICLGYAGVSRVAYTAMLGPFLAKPKPTKAVFRAMEKRGWLEYVSRQNTGGLMGTLPNGKQGIVAVHFELQYRLSEKGKKAASKL